jgi:CheY-like chemotaxis protein
MQAQKAPELEQLTSVILLVEDSDEDALYIQLAFERAGCAREIIRVPHGEHALQYLLGLPPYEDRSRYPFPSLVLLDLAMPQMDGWGLLSHIREVARWKHLPVVVLTGSVDLRNAKRAYAEGADAFVVKPLSLKDYVDEARLIAEKWLQNSPPSSPNAARTPNPALSTLSR